MVVQCVDAGLVFFSSVFLRTAGVNLMYRQWLFSFIHYKEECTFSIVRYVHWLCNIDNKKKKSMRNILSSRCYISNNDTYVCLCIYVCIHVMHKEKWWKLRPFTFYYRTFPFPCVVRLFDDFFRIIEFIFCCCIFLQIA